MNTDDQAQQNTIGKILSIRKCDKYYEIKYTTGEQARLYILNDHVFRFYLCPSGDFLDYPKPMHPKHTAKINVKSVEEYDIASFRNSVLNEFSSTFAIHTNHIVIHFEKVAPIMKVYTRRNLKLVLREVRPLSYAKNKVKQTLHQNDNEYFFGGGLQNGRFSHKGKLIKIENSNYWLNHGVSSPCPFYWSTNGYGVLRNTWQPGIYDFGSKTPHSINTVHKGTDFDAFFFINAQPKDILKDYYELTGEPIFMPEYAFYQAHFNAFNRDYWVEVDANTSAGLLFEDGKQYMKYEPPRIDDKENTIIESLNGEKNYQFSARAMINRYHIYDMPLGWFVPNDGYVYVAGYGQTNSLDGDIENLKDFVEFAKENGVHVALMTKFYLLPKDQKNPDKGERDLYKEVGEAGVVGLKCDITSVGHGYSSAANFIEEAAKIFEKSTKRHRKMMIMVDGWAGTQRHSGVWTGNQHGGEWEYIRFHIPTYIGSGLSGIPVVGSDMDGIFKGGDKIINVRDYQWKAFTPLQINMDGNGWTKKTPFSFDEEATAINRAYLKLKSMMMPYNYTLGHESTKAMPMVRAMFLEFPQGNQSYTLDSQYQFMWGPNLLVAPVYKEENYKGEPIRHGIYLPDANQIWIDLFTGKKYQGGKTLNYFKCPLWKIPVFVKDGAIIPMTLPNNYPGEIKRDRRVFNIYANRLSSFTIFEDDGESSEHLQGHFAETDIIVDGPTSNESGSLHIHIDKTKGSYEGMVKNRITLLRIMASKNVSKVSISINEKSLQVSEVKNIKDFYANDNVYFFNDKFIINPYLEIFGREILHQKFLMIKLKKLDVTKSKIQIKIDEFVNRSEILFGENTLKDNLYVPSEFGVMDEDIKSTSLSPSWQPVQGAAYYEIQRDGDLFTNILGTKFLFDHFDYESPHHFRIRSVNSHRQHSNWSNILHVTTKGDPYRYVVQGVQVTCNLPCQPGQDVEKLTDADEDTLWHTDWGTAGKAKPEKGIFINLHFNLGAVHKIKKVEYQPRRDAGNGTILYLKYTTSADGITWKETSKDIKFPYNSHSKVILLNGLRFRYMKVIITRTVGEFGSGIHFRFYKDMF